MLAGHVYALTMQDQASAEASAHEAATQLLAEEEQAAARVAAKKAKKLRQKQAKQQHPNPPAADLESAPQIDTEDTVAQLISDGNDLGALHSGPEMISQGEQAEQNASAVEQSCAKLMLHESPAGAVSEGCITEAATHHLAAAASPAESLDQSREAALPQSQSTSRESPIKAGSQQSSDAMFLKNLFCCPITQVHALLVISLGDLTICTQTIAIIMLTNACSCQTASDWSKEHHLSCCHRSCHFDAGPVNLQGSLNCICEQPQQSKHMSTASQRLM